MRAPLYQLTLYFICSCSLIVGPFGKRLSFWLRFFFLLCYFYYWTLSIYTYWTCGKYVSLLLTQLTLLTKITPITPFYSKVFACRCGCSFHLMLPTFLVYLSFVNVSWCVWMQTLVSAVSACGCMRMHADSCLCALFCLILTSALLCFSLKSVSFRFSHQIWLIRSHAQYQLHSISFLILPYYASVSNLSHSA